jgi:hypothetical protein
VQPLNMPKAGWLWLAGGAVFFAALFTHGYAWYTPSAAGVLAKQTAEVAVATALAPVCADRFKHANNASANLVALKNIASEYDQEAFVAKAGWDKMPGSDAAISGVAKRCAQLLTGS